MSELETREALLREVLEREEHAAFLAELRTRCLVLLAQKRRQRVAWRWILSAAGLLLAAGLFALVAYHDSSEPSREAAPVDEPPFVFRTRPLRAEQLVHAEARVEVIRSAEAVNLVTTRAHVESLSDEDLFALFPERPLALVQLTAEAKQLVFLDQP